MVSKQKREKIMPQKDIETADENAEEEGKKEPVKLSNCSDQSSEQWHSDAKFRDGIFVQFFFLPLFQTLKNVRSSSRMDLGTSSF